MASPLKIGMTMKKGFFANEGAEKFSTLSAAAHALRAAADGLDGSEPGDSRRIVNSSACDIVYLVPGQALLPIDGLIMPGGDDIDPTHYGRPDLLHLLEKVDYEYDSFELEVARWALERQLPILGVCRGIQTLNVACGGTLQPRLDSQSRHFSQIANDDDNRRPDPVHSLRVAPNSRLWQVFEKDRVEVNSIHKGGLDQIAPNLRATAWAEDGVIEAVESHSGSWIHGVLFHPEDLCRSEPRWLRLFRQFLDAASDVPDSLEPRPLSA